MLGQEVEGWEAESSPSGAEQSPVGVSRENFSLLTGCADRLQGAGPTSQQDKRGILPSLV